jgi:hypothetical protein
VLVEGGRAQVAAYGRGFIPGGHQLFDHRENA